MAHLSEGALPQTPARSLAGTPAPRSVPSHTAQLFALLAVLALLAAGAVVAPGSAVRAAPQDIVRLEANTPVQLGTPAFLEQGKRYAFTWPGGGPSQTYIVKQLRPDGWILVDVADENTRPEFYAPGEFPTRWLHVGLAMSVQEMRPLP